MYVDYTQDQKIYSQYIASDAYDVCKEVKGIFDMLASRFALAYEQCFDIKVILCELLQNAILHGNECDINKKIHLEIWYKEKRKVLEIRVKDQGCGFNTQNQFNLSIPDCHNHDILQMDESGRGLLIVKELCDNLEFNNKGNTITVTKKL